MLRYLCSALAALMVSSIAGAQSFHIDFDIASGTGSGPPSAGFYGAGGSKGHWNVIRSTSPYIRMPLVPTNGAATQVTLTRLNQNTTFSSMRDVHVSGDTSLLLCDFETPNDPNRSLEYIFLNLEPGTYAVYTYGMKPASSNTTVVQVTGSTAPLQVVGVNPTNNDLLPLKHYALHLVEVPTNSALQILVGRQSNQSVPVCGGLQIKKLSNGARLRLYVNDTQTGTQNGGYWAGAFRDLQTALVAADVIKAYNVEIWVAEGTYKPVTTTDRTVSFAVPKGLNLHGGFAGSESTLAMRSNPLSHPTILSGNIGGSGPDDNTYHVVKLIDEMDNPPRALIDGFVVERGNSLGSPLSPDGDCVLDHWAGLNFELRNCHLRAGHGGGSLVHTTGTTDFLGCTFSNAFGAGLTGPVGKLTNCQFYAMHIGARISGWAVLENCFFRGNYIGLIHESNLSQVLTLSNCTFAGNSEQGVRGVVNHNYLRIDTRNSIIWDNGNRSFDDQVEVKVSNGGTGDFDIELQYSRVHGTGQDNPEFLDLNGPDDIMGTTDDSAMVSNTSPCIDAGANGFAAFDFFDMDADGNTTERTPRDLLGAVRNIEISTIPNEGMGGSPVIDQGCVEVQRFCAADFDGDGFVTGEDLDAFMEAFDVADQSADFYRDGYVSGDDLDLFLAEFDAAC